MLLKSLSPFNQEGASLEKFQLSLLLAYALKALPLVKKDSSSLFELTFTFPS
jgi:hypothetical protein